MRAAARGWQRDRRRVHPQVVDAYGRCHRKLLEPCLEQDARRVQKESGDGPMKDHGEALEGERGADGRHGSVKVAGALPKLFHECSGEV